MGTINYKTSDYITLGLRPYDVDDFINDDDFIEQYAEWVGRGNSTAEEFAYQVIGDYENDDYENVKSILGKDGHRGFFNVTIEAGYYDGFSLNIENNFPVAFDCWQDKRDAQKEITEIKRLLIECAGVGMVACYPWWCTTYEDYAGTIKKINEAIKAMREEVRTTPTWSWYEADRHCKTF